MRTLNNEAASKLKKTLILSGQEIDDYLNLIKESLKVPGDVYTTLHEKISKVKKDTDPEEIYDIYSTFYNLARFFDDSDYERTFKQDLAKFKFTSEEINKVSFIIDKMIQLDLTSELVDHHYKSLLQDSIVPRLQYINLSYSYKVLNKRNGSKELVPIIQGTVVTRRSSINRDEEFNFQFSPFNLDVLINEFQRIKADFHEYNEFLKSKVEVSKND
jgi:hypothetical protein